MNTTEKGNKFEDEVFKEIKELLESGSLGLIPDCCHLFQKKGYYSRDRDSDIILDISIEVWMPGADRWSMLWACECKDCSRPVSVDDIEEYKAKLNQIAGVNVKGMFATSSAYQRSAYNYAASNGIGLLRLLPKEQIEVVFYHMMPEEFERRRKLECEKGFFNQSHISEFGGFYSIHDGITYHDWEALLESYFSEFTKTD